MASRSTERADFKTKIDEEPVATVACKRVGCAVSIVKNGEG